MEPLIDRLPDRIEQGVRDTLAKACEASLTLATAESCSGGLLAALLTDVEGYGHAFERGFVVYTDEAKREMLGVSAELVARHGAVSRPVALAMALGALAHSRADIALSITGFAGSAGPADEPGLVHFACARREREPVHLEAHYGDAGRTVVRAQAIETALRLIDNAIA